MIHIVWLRLHISTTLEESGTQHQNTSVDSIADWATMQLGMPGNAVQFYMSTGAAVDYWLQMKAHARWNTKSGTSEALAPYCTVFHHPLRHRRCSIFWSNLMHAAELQVHTSRIRSSNLRGKDRALVNNLFKVICELMSPLVLQVWLAGLRVCYTCAADCYTPRLRPLRSSVPSLPLR